MAEKLQGGSNGIGLATAQRFIDEGGYVFITGRRQRELDIAVNQIIKSHIRTASERIPIPYV
jgi:short-subunit dehydrogenase involved in D-alanine esterification of teichoic acids